MRIMASMQHSEKCTRVHTAQDTKWIGHLSHRFIEMHRHLIKFLCAHPMIGKVKIYGNFSLYTYTFYWNAGEHRNEDERNATQNTKNKKKNNREIILWQQEQHQPAVADSISRASNCLGMLAEIINRDMLSFSFIYWPLYAMS